MGMSAFSELKAMIGYQNDSISVNETEQNFDKLGLVTMHDVGTNIPFYGFDLPINDEEKCGGDCYQFIEEHYDFVWEQTVATSLYDNKVTHH